MQLEFGTEMNTTDRQYVDFAGRGDVNVSMTAIFVLDGAVDDWEVRRSITEFADLVPRFRQRVVAGLGGLDRFSPTETLNLDAHHHVVDLSERPSSRRGLGAVLEHVRRFQGESFPPDRPPWRTAHYTALEGGRCALALNMNHVMGDGATLVSAFQQAFGTSDATYLSSVDLSHANKRPPPVADAMAMGSKLWRGAAVLSRTVVGLLRSEERATVKHTLSTFTTKPPCTRYGNSTRQQQPICWSVEESAWRASALNAGCKPNELFLSLASASYISSGGEAADAHDVTVAMPVDSRSLAYDRSQSACSAVRGALINIDSRTAGSPVGLSEISKKAHAARRAALSERDDGSMFDLIALLPRKLRGDLLLRAFMKTDVVASNVGQLQPLAIAGRPVSSLHFVIPALGCPLGICVTLYRGRYFFTCQIDPNMVPDIETLRNGVEQRMNSLALDSWRWDN